MQTLLDVRRETLRRDDAVFCQFLQGGAETVVTRGALWREAARYANLLRARGVQPGEVVVIILKHSPDLFYSFLGAMLVGAIPSFMPPPSAKQNPQLYWQAHEKLFARLQTGTLLTRGEYLAAVAQNLPELTLRVIDAESAASFPTETEIAEVAAHDTVLLQHSSGTTGLKKGVALSHRAVLQQIASYGRAIALRPDDRIVSWLPLYHDMGLIACYLLPLVTGTPVVMLDPFEWVVNPPSLFDAIKKFRATLCWQPNFAFHHLCRTVRPSDQIDLSSMRLWNDCSEPCRAESLQLFARTFGRVGVKPDQLQVCYAMAETVFAVTQTTPGTVPKVLHVDPESLRASRRIVVTDEGKPHQTFLSAGHSIAGLHVRITGEAGATESEDKVGTISVSGDCLFEGYFKLSEQTQRVLRNGWYETGDLGFLHEGELYVTGRSRDLIIVHGRNYYAHELEYLVNQVPGVHPGRNVATGWFRPEVGSEEIVIIAEPNAEAKVDRAQLAQTIKQMLLSQAGLTVFDVHLVNPGWLVKTTSGKISRSENLGKYLVDVGRAAAA